MIAASFVRALTLQVKTRRHLLPALCVQLLLLFICAPSIMAQASKSPVKTSGQTAKAVEAPMKITGIHYASGNRRDPFLNPLLLKKSPKPEDEELSRGLPPPGIAGTYIAQAILQGTSIRDDRKLAVVRGADTRAYFLKEGDRLFDGYLKTIDNDSITLVRETKMRSGKTLTQDVIKRLRTP